MTDVELQHLQDTFIADFQKHYPNKNNIGDCFKKLTEKELPIEFYDFLIKSKGLAKYSVILSNLPLPIYDLELRAIINGLAWTKVAFGARINPYVHKRVRDTHVDNWLKIHKEWDKFAKKRRLFTTR